MRGAMRSLLRSPPSVVPALTVALACLTTCAARAGVREDFLKLIDRPRVALDAQVSAAVKVRPEMLAEYHFSFAAEATQRVPGILVKRIDGPSTRRPVVIALHGTGGAKENELPLLRTLAGRGFVAV